MLYREASTGNQRTTQEIHTNILAAFVVMPENGPEEISSALRLLDDVKEIGYIISSTLHFIAQLGKVRLSSQIGRERT